MCCTCVNVLNYPCAVMFVGNCFSTPCWRNVAHVLYMCCTCVSVLKYPCAREKLKEIPGKWLPGSRKMQKMISRFPENNIFCTCVHVFCTCAHVNAHVCTCGYMWIHSAHALYMGILASPRRALIHCYDIESRDTDRTRPQDCQKMEFKILDDVVMSS